MVNDVCVQRTRFCDKHSTRNDACACVGLANLEWAFRKRIELRASDFVAHFYGLG